MSLTPRSPTSRTRFPAAGSRVETDFCGQPGDGLCSAQSSGRWGQPRRASGFRRRIEARSDEDVQVPSGPFAEKPYYTPNDVEAICSEELQKLGFFPSAPGPYRIDRFIEKRFNLQPTYEDLPNGPPGFTRFGAKGVEEIVITTALDEEGQAPRRATTENDLGA